MKPMTNQQHVAYIMARQQLTIRQDDLRYKALERDWNRLRDIEEQWRRFHQTVVYAAALCGVLFVGFMLITGGST